MTDTYPVDCVHINIGGPREIHYWDAVPEPDAKQKPLNSQITEVEGAIDALQLTLRRLQSAAFISEYRESHPQRTA